MKNTCKYLLVSLMASVALSCPAPAQTIARRDLPRFVGAVAFPDLNKLDAPDLSRFITWYIDSVDSSGRRYIDQNPPARSADTYWVASPRVAFDEPTSGKGWTILNSEAGWFYYVILGDANGFMDQWNLLSVWRASGGDSLTFVCMDYGNYNSSIGYSKIVRLGSFPDKSLFLYVQSIGGDEELLRTDAFLRSNDSCHFERFYDIEAELPSPSERMVLADHLDSRVYSISVVTNYFSDDTTKRDLAGEPAHVLDSARAEVLDLWQLAVQKFNIDTTKIGARQR